MSDVVHSPLPALLDRLGLARSPFPPTPDSEHYFETDSLRCDLAEVTHCLLARKGFALLTGEVGRGKTTFLRRVLANVEAAGARTSLVVNTFLQGRDLLSAVLRDFGLDADGDAAANLARLDAFLVRCWRAGTPCVLFIDDAQNLQAESLELLRLLSNLESGQEKLLQILLAGQPELEDMLARHELRQLASRIVRHVRLSPLDAAQTAGYVAFRLGSAGGAGVDVTARAAAALHRDSGGNPRRIHVIMDRCLYGLVAQRASTVDATLVRRAASEAGFARARRPWRRALSVGAVAAALGGVAAAGVQLRQPSPPSSVLAPVPAAPAGATAFDACLARLSRSGGGVELMSIPASQLTLLPPRSDTCVDRTATGRVARAIPALTPSSKHALLAMQRRLASHGDFAEDGLDTDPVDGKPGPRTRAALVRFQQRHGLPTTGEADAATRLLLDAAPFAHPAHASLPETLNGRG